MSSMPEFEFVKVERKGTDGRVGLVTLNRPKALNALFNPLMNDLIEAFKNLDEDPTVGAMVLTGKLFQINVKFYENLLAIASTIPLFMALLCHMIKGIEGLLKVIRYVL